ncbi:MAG: hypothetical protein R3C26_06380 [Calditrichia bacterium]
MIIYEVNLDIDRSIETEYASFYGIILMKCCSSTVLNQPNGLSGKEGNEKIACWTVHYHLRSMADLDTILSITPHACVAMAKINSATVLRQTGGFCAR